MVSFHDCMYYGLKVTLAYYTRDGGVTFCTMLDAMKAFDCVECRLL